MKEVQLIFRYPCKRTHRTERAFLACTQKLLRTVFSKSSKRLLPRVTKITKCPMEYVYERNMRITEKKIKCVLTTIQTVSVINVAHYHCVTVRQATIFAGHSILFARQMRRNFATFSYCRQSHRLKSALWRLSS